MSLAKQVPVVPHILTAMAKVVNGENAPQRRESFEKCSADPPAYIRDCPMAQRLMSAPEEV